MMKNLIKLFGLLLLLVGCSKSDGVEEPKMPDNPHEVEPLPTNVELAESTVQLNNAQLTFLDSVDEENTTLTFSAALPAEYLPQEGQILLQMTPTEALPYGFVGRVTKIEQSANGYIVHTDTPTLTEIFNKLQVEGELQAATESRAIPTDDEGYYMIEFPIDLSAKGMKVEGGINNGFRPRLRVVSDAETGKKEIFFRFDTKKETNIAIVCTPNLELDDMWNIGHGVLLSMTTGGLPVATYLQPYIASELEVTAGANMGVTFRDYNSYTIEYDGSLPKITTVEENSTEKYTMAPQFDVSSLVAGYFDIVVGVRVDFRLFGRKNLSAGIGPEVGFGAEGEVGLQLVEENKGAESVYDALKDNHVAFSGYVDVSGHLDVTFLNKEAERWRGVLASFTFAEKSFYLFPEFDDCAIEETNGTINATTTVKRDLLLPANVGIASYQDGEVKKYGKSYAYHYANDFQENPIKESFKDEKDTEYWTYIKFGGNYVKGEKLERSKLRHMLIQFYKDTGGDNWTRNDNWCSDKPLNQWYGVYLNESDEEDEEGDEEDYDEEDVNVDIADEDIFSLELSLIDNNLVGKGDLSDCPELVSLELAYNKLTALDVSNCTAMYELYCEDNQLTSLNLSGCKALISLDCSKNRLPSLDVWDCTALEGLSCGNNQITSLNLAGYTALQTLWCDENQLTTLSLLGCKALESLSCEQNNLETLDVSGLSALTHLACSGNSNLISLNLSGCKKLGYLNCGNSNGDCAWGCSSEGGKLTSLDLSDCENLCEVDCGHNQLTSLRTSYHPNLLRFDCHHNQLTSLDVSGFSALEWLDCQNNQLTSLNVTGCWALEDLDCRENQLTTLDVSGLEALAFLDCTNNQLTSLNASGCSGLHNTSLRLGANPLTTLNLSCTALKILDVSDSYYDYDLNCLVGGHLTSLDVSGCTTLKELYCNCAMLSSLDLSGCAALEKLTCNSQLASLDLSGFTKLKTLGYEGMQQSSLDVSGCIALESLGIGDRVTSLNASGCTSIEKFYASGGALTSLDVSGCSALRELHCDYNQLNSLNVSGCRSLYLLDCSYNNLTSLNASVCSALELLYCENNLLTNLNAAKCTSLHTLEFENNNQLASLDVSGSALKELVYRNHDLTSLNVSGCTKLEKLDCGHNNLTSLNVSGCTMLKDLECCHNNLTSLDATSCTALRDLSCNGNPITQMITSFYKALRSFSYDERYEYREIWYYTKYVDAWFYKYNDHHGWYYPNEPYARYIYGGN